MAVAISKKRYQRRLAGLLIIVAANLVGIGVASYNLMTVAEAAQVEAVTGESLQRVDVDISPETADMLSADLQYLINNAAETIQLEGEIYLDETIYLAEGQNVTIDGDFALSASSADPAFDLAPDSNLSILGGLFDGGMGLGFALDRAELNIFGSQFQGFSGGLVELWNSDLNIRGGGFVGNGSPATNGGVASSF
ncbi:MAG: hypothetical protein FWB98_01840, partial [Defluviitaleaceae bacterium]|nr:hypothetical protein [Defluviitaleaceae bacterium]